MILIIDSGSTKSDWILADQKGKFIDSFTTLGFNPFFHSASFIAEEIKKNQQLLNLADAITQIYYYGAGCSSIEHQKTVSEALAKVFIKARATVEHDMLAAAYATYDGNPGISCILGTGSNACFFDGKSFKNLNAGLGYILGDEGSGSFFGKKLLAAYLYESLPKGLHDELEVEFKLSRAEIFRNVYEMPNANVYLASFTKFIAQHHQHPFIKNMLFEGMKQFLEIHVCSFPDYKKFKVHFVGSIAFHFSQPIREAAKVLDISVGQIIKSPIQNLLQYHVNYIFSKP